MTSIEKSAIEYHLKLLKEEIGKDGNIISIKIIFPQDSTLQSLKNILILNNLFLDKDYFDFEKKFVYLDSDGNVSDKIQRSLTFLKYNESVKYKTFNRKSSQLSSNVLDIKPLENVIIGITDNDLQNLANVEKWWKHWVKMVKSCFSHSQSTLWSYIVLRLNENGVWQEYISSAFLIFDCKLDYSKRTMINKYCQDLLFLLLGSQFFLEIKINATRAAISQVMTRNLSHNIGSHVLSKLLKDEQIRKIYFKNKDGEKVSNNNDIQSILTNDKVFYQCLNTLKDIDIDSRGNISIENKENNESLLATFFNYLKTRMDYLSDVTTSTPVIENTRGFYNDMIKSFIQNRVLNDRISGIDTFNYEMTAYKPDIIKNDGKNCNDIKTKDNCLCKLSDTTDLLVSIPNDVLGIQAFYTILENIIRNTAKHGYAPVKKGVNENNGKASFEFKIKVEEANAIFTDIDIPNGIDFDQYYAISIFDNCNLSEKEVIDIDKVTVNDREEIRKKQCYKEKITEGKIKKIDKLVIDQNNLLNKSILENNQLRHGGWGLIEMDSSAAYLRKLSVELVDSDDYEINDLHGKCPISKGKQICIYQAYAEQGKYLGYRFFMYKPREMLVIGDVEKLLDNINDKVAKLKDLKNKGIWIKSKNEIEEDIKNQTVFPHRLIVITNENSELKIKIQNNPCFSKRILIMQKEDSIDFNSFLSIWQLFYKNNKDSIGINIIRNNHGETYCSIVENNNYVEITNSATNHFYNTEKRYVEWNIDYSYPLRIVVIDERIQYFAKHEKYAIKQPNSGNCNANVCYHKVGVPFSLLYEKTNVLVPNMENDCNLNEQNFYGQREPEYQKIINYLQNIFVKKIIDEDVSEGDKMIDSSKEKTEFLVIHLGIIEKLITAWNNNNSVKYDKEKTEQVGSFIKEQILKLTHSDMNEETLMLLYDRVIVTSGRGKPHNLPDDIRYINFSVISQYLINQRNKYAFTEALYSARKTIYTNEYEH